ncbi:LysE family translocator [Salinarimonas ramus]|uniref:Threonine/homoserine/homoserine lactone efflux protein n=1 Tax=Salinarimonas ramus TaxID=690164 RepID=A0A917QIF5_9HYPH|nr:LysE family transporter [Salinarimonas ramus]GGK51905.1 hypothetical protein GCM10011322_43670 [Salinarimonas ramus]
METTLASLAALAGAMALLAATPSVSVLAVTARAASGGFAHGAATSLGIVAGDVVWLLVALFGLELLDRALGDSAYLVRWAGAAYVIWIGVALLRAGAPGPAERSGAGSLAGSALAGLTITLADQKAVLFYLGFLPAFVSLDSIGAGEIALLVLVIAVAVGAVKLVYAALAARAGAALGARAGLWLGRLAGGVLILVGVALLVRA